MLAQTKTGKIPFSQNMKELSIILQRVIRLNAWLQILAKRHLIILRSDMTRERDITVALKLASTCASIPTFFFIPIFH